MGNLFNCNCVNIGGVNFNVYYLETKVGKNSNGSEDLYDYSDDIVITWDCTSIPNWKKLTVDNFNLCGGDSSIETFRVYTSFSGMGNTNLKRGFSIHVKNTAYDSTNGIYTAVFGRSITVGDSGNAGGFTAKLWVTPKVLVVN